MTEVLQIYINCKYENGNDIRIYEVGDKINQSTKLNCKKSFQRPKKMIIYDFLHRNR